MALADISLPLADIQDEAIEALFGVGEAIGHTLLSAIYRLMHNREATVRLRDEIARNDLKLDALIEMDQMVQFPYLVCHVAEIMQCLLKVLTAYRPAHSTKA